MPYVIPYINTILSCHSSTEKHTVFYEKHLTPLYLRVYACKNLRIQKKDINFAPIFVPCYIYKVWKILKNVTKS